MGRQAVGFGAEKITAKERAENGGYANVEAQDIVKYGLIPELVGRLPVITTLSSLDTEALKRILREPKNSLTKQYTELLKLDGIELSFDDSACEAIAKLAIKRNTGARGLRSIVEKLMLDIMYEAPSDEEKKPIVITADDEKVDYGE